MPLHSINDLHNNSQQEFLHQSINKKRGDLMLKQLLLWRVTSHKFNNGYVVHEHESRRSIIIAPLWLGVPLPFTIHQVTFPQEI
jgi:hypothetical protein